MTHVPKKNRKSYKYRDMKNNWSLMDHWSNNYAREELFHQVKFITSDEQLHSYEEKGSVGHAFLTKYESVHQMDGIVTQEDRHRLWLGAKDIICVAINRKRNNLCNQLKNHFSIYFYVSNNKPFLIICVIGKFYLHQHLFVFYLLTFISLF